MGISVSTFHSVDKHTDYDVEVIIAHNVDYVASVYCERDLFLEHIGLLATTKQSALMIFVLRQQLFGAFMCSKKCRHD